MTREEVLHKLNILSCYAEYEEEREALEIAIQALEHPERNVVAVVPCGDTVSRQAVLEVVNNPLNIKLDKIIEKLPSVTPKQRTGKWIPVSERLPEEYGEYLITWTSILGEHSTKRTKPLIAIAEYEIYESENYADWITTMYEFEYYHDIKVLAWMPLPEPYKEGESE